MEELVLTHLQLFSVIYGIFFKDALIELCGNVALIMRSGWGSVMESGSASISI
jgi:hypothetical protein